MNKNNDELALRPGGGLGSRECNVGAGPRAVRGQDEEGRRARSGYRLPFTDTKSTTTTYSKDWIVQCAKAGSPLGILTADGSTYLPVTTTMPDMGQDQVKPLVGEMVEAKGKVFERNGGPAIEIEEIHKLPAPFTDK
jgi:hypothetical protein